MKKFLIAIAFAFMSLTANASPQVGTQADCTSQVPYGTPKDTIANTTTICRKAYILEHDNVAKIPVWASYTLTPKHSEGCEPRSNKFAPDASLPKGKRAENDDYRNSGYDKGHIVNNADMAWDPDVDQESFILSNMTPQIHPFNAGIWEELEKNVRGWAFNRQHTMLVYAGPIYDVKSDKTIGANKVVVPHAFYKIVVDTVTKESMAFEFPHADAHSTDLKPFLTSVSDIEKKTGIVFAVPSSKTTVGTLWPDDLNKYNKDKQAVCKLTK